MDYTCTSLVFHTERLQKRYQGLLKGAMSLSIWKWIQKYRPEKISYERRISEFIVDETQIKVGHDHLWIWVAIEPKRKSILDIYLSAERTMFVAEHFFFRIS